MTTVEDDGDTQAIVRAVGAAFNGVVLADARRPDCPLVYTNAAFLHMTGYSEADVIGRNCRFLQGEGTDPAAIRELREAVRGERGCQVLILNYRKDGSAFWNEVTVSPVRDSHGALTHFIGIQTDTTVRQEAEGERRRLLAELHIRAEREALINRIGQALRESLDPAAIQEQAAALVGEALGADRCYFSVYDPQRDAVRISRDWHRPDLPSVAGEYLLAEYRGYVDALYADGTAAIADAQDPDVPPDVRRVLGGFGIRAFLAVPLFDGGRFTAALAASMGGPRAWTPDDVALMEAVLTLTRTAVEAARLREREHRIAEQLQAALQPPLPQSVVGLKLAKYYEAALDEAGVGGDFFDCFPVEKGCTVLAVGDLSGKGLAAAAQVSTVRNMLRAFLYSKPTLAEAVTDLNRVIALNGLLSGFATLWVGCYDGARGALAYVNMGQEPALLRRASTGEIESLLPTGPVLGADANAAYEEQTVALSPGDTLAVFTDGVTECGRSRREMLGIEGAAALLRPAFAPGESEDAQTMAEAVALRLVEGVDAASRGGVAKDDLCILVAVAEGGSPLVTSQTQVPFPASAETARP